MGPLMSKIADATPAALARMTAHSSLPICIDEAEPSSEWVLELFKLLRVASGAEGLRVRADSTGDGIVTQQPKFAAMLSSTAAPALSRADESRQTTVRLGKEVEDWPVVRDGIKTAMKHRRGRPVPNHLQRARDRGRCGQDD